MGNPLSIALGRLRVAWRGDRGIAEQMIRGASGTALLKVFQQGAVFLTVIVLGRALGATGFGIYAYAISWVTLLGVFAKAGINQVIIRNVAVYREENDWGHIRGIFRFALLLVFSAGVACASVLALIATLLHFDARTMRTALWCACFLLPLQAMSVPFGSVQQGLKQITYAQIPQLLITPLVFLVAILGVYQLAPALLTGAGVIFLRVVTVLISLSVAALLLRRGFINAAMPKTLPKPAYRPYAWLAGAMPLVLVGSMFIVNSNADILMLGSLKGPEAAGIYKAATRGAELLIFSLAVVNAPLGPQIARLHAAGDRRKLQHVVSYAAVAASIPAAVLALLFVFKGEWFLQLFGAEFVGHAATISLAILSMGQLVNVAAGSVALLMVMTNHGSAVARVAVLGAVLNVVLNAILIPGLGIVGAAIATAISTVIWNLILVVEVVRRLMVNPTVLPSLWFKRFGILA